MLFVLVILVICWRLCYCLLSLSGISSSDTLIWLLYVAMLCLFALFYVFYQGRLWGLIISILLDKYTWKSGISIRCGRCSLCPIFMLPRLRTTGSVKLSFLGGKILVRNVRIFTKDVAIHIVEGYFCYQYWLRHVRSGENPDGLFNRKE